MTNDGSTPQPGAVPVPSRRPRLVACLVLFALAWVAYAGTLSNDFVAFDDPNYITANEAVQQGLGFDGLRYAFSPEQAANWHPLTWLSHMLDCSLFGLDAGLHHAMNVLLHGIAGCLLFLAFCRMSADPWPALVVAALFVLHPLRVESVAWASERKDVLAGLFWMATLFAYARFVERPSVGRYVLTAVAFALGLLAKPMLVTLPFALLLLDVWPLRRQAAGAVRLVVEKLPLIGLSLVSVVMTLSAQAGGGSVRALSSLDLSTRLAMVPRAYVHYVWKTVWPTDLAAFYPHPAIGTGASLSPADGETLAALGLLAGLTALAWWQRRRAPWGLVGWLWFLGTLVPVIGIVQVGDQAYADRYTYVPVVGLTLPVAWGLAAWARGGRTRLRAAAAGAMAVLGACLVLTWQQARTWRDTDALFSHALEVTEGNYLAHTFVGIEREQEGRIAEAERHFEAALAARPDYVVALSRLGNSLMRRGQGDRARPLFERVLRNAPTDVGARVSLSVLYLNADELDAAQAVLTEALRLDPDNALALGNLGALAEERGDDAAAARHYAAAIAADPTFTPPRLNLAALHERRGDVARAAAVYREMLAALPGNALALRSLAWLLATTSDPAVRDPAEAQRLAREAAQRARRVGHLHTATRAAAAAAVGRFDEAVRLQERALSQAPTAARPELQQHLARYRAGRALSL